MLGVSPRSGPDTAGGWHDWKWLSEFRDFALKGNVVDLAVGMIIGVAFGKIVSALVENVLMPPIGLLLRRRRLQGPCRQHWHGARPRCSSSIGVFLQTLIDFLIVALVLFLVIKGMNALKKRFETQPPRSRPSRRSRRSISRKSATRW